MADNVLERQPRSWFVASAAAASIALLYRYASHAGFSNDHFIHLARAQALLAGDWPVRDYMEEGVPLTVMLSAGAQRVLGESPFAELVLSTGAMAIAAGLTCWLTAAMTRSALIGIGAALLQALARPRLYSYPKILLYPALMLLAWRYLDRPSRGRLAILSGFTVVAFLMRHDHGVYAGLGACAAIAVANWPLGLPVMARRLGEFGLLALLFVSPYLAYVQYYGGVVSYFGTGIAISQTEAVRTSAVHAEFDPLPEGRWIESHPSDPTRLPAVRVQWQPTVGPALRVSLERALGLQHPEHDSGTTWVYRIEPPVDDTLANLVALPEARDTAGFNRRTLALDVPLPWYSELQHVAGLDRTFTTGPRLDAALSARNQAVALYWFVWALPLAAVVWLVAERRQGRRELAGPVLTLVAIVVITSLGLFRESLEARASDVYGTVPILAAWVMAKCWTWRPGRIWRWAGRAAVVVVLLGVIVATSRVGDAANAVELAGLLDGPLAVEARIEDVTRDARTYPWARQWPAGSGWRVARYVRDCTSQNDRLLVTWNKPEMNVWAQRPFASGETLLVPALRPPSMFAARAFARLKTQSVPIVLVQPSTYAQDFQTLYPEIAAFIEDRYRKVGHFGNDARDDVDVYVEKNRTPIGVDAEFQWPCFR